MPASRFTATSLPTAGTAAPTPTPTPTQSPTVHGCAGDCDASGAVTIDELLKGVNIAAGVADLAGCSAIDADGDGEVTIAELIAAVNDALSGCPTSAASHNGQSSSRS